MILNEVSFDKRTVPLSTSECDPTENAFTVLTGHNGSGKSRLFCKICQIYVALMLEGHVSEHSIGEFFKDYSGVNSDLSGKLVFTRDSTIYSANYSYEAVLPHGISSSDFTEEVLHILLQQAKTEGRKRLNLDYLENGNSSENTKGIGKLIVVSSSPFDKFPIPENGRAWYVAELLENYVYRGARTQGSFERSYLRSKFFQLGTSFLNIFLKPRQTNNQLELLFEFLGFEQKFILKLRLADRFHISDLDNESNATAMVAAIRQFKGILGEQDNLATSEVESIIKSANAIISAIENENENENGIDHYSRNRVYSLSLDLHQPDNEPALLKALLVLVNYDLMDLADIQFQKSSGENHLLTEASSGEMCMLFNVLAISSSISDDSIVLIDEPELSLHPEWQKKFLPLIKKVFSPYRGCHFLLATHSPLIVSSMSERNTFAVDMKERNPVALSGAAYSHQSVDYQLAKVFKTPGYKNEYLIGQAVDLLAILADGGELDGEFLKRAQDLFDIDEFTDTNDPAKRLIGTLQKAIGVLKRG